MIGLYPNILIVTLNVSDLNTLIKRGTNRLKFFKKDPNIFSLQKIYFEYKQKDEKNKPNNIF